MEDIAFHTIDADEHTKKELLFAAARRTLAFFGNFRSEIQTWESTSFGAKLGKKRGNQQVFTK